MKQAGNVNLSNELIHSWGVVAYTFNLWALARLKEEDCHESRASYQASQAYTVRSYFKQTN